MYRFSQSTTTRGHGYTDSANQRRVGPKSVNQRQIGTDSANQRQPGSKDCVGRFEFRLQTDLLLKSMKSEFVSFYDENKKKSPFMEKMSFRLLRAIGILLSLTTSIGSCEIRFFFLS